MFAFSYLNTLDTTYSCCIVCGDLADKMKKLPAENF